MTEQDAPFAPRIGSIQTRWSLVRRAHGDAEATCIDARRLLVMRYSSAIRSYIRAITQSEEKADDLAQDAVVRLLKGDFAGADPDRGRFRDLLKTAIRNMVRNHWKHEATRSTVAFDLETAPGEVEPENADPWEAGWRRTVLDLALARLQDVERETPKNLAHTLLLTRIKYPDATSQQLAEIVQKATGQEIRADTLRQKLRRARIRFAELLIQEVADGLADPTADRIEEELLTLGLWENIRGILPDDWREKLF